MSTLFIQATDRGTSIEEALAITGSAAALTDQGIPLEVAVERAFAAAGAEPTTAAITEVPPDEAAEDKPTRRPGRELKAEWNKATAEALEGIDLDSTPVPELIQILDREPGTPRMATMGTSITEATADGGGSVKHLSDEAQGRLNLRTGTGLQAIGDAFRAYGKKIGAPEWASYDYGETARFVEFFVPTAKDLVEAHLDEYHHPTADEWPSIAQAVLRRIKNAVSEQPPLPKMVHTYPWRPSELFGRQDFLEAMFAMISKHFPHHVSIDSAIEIRERLQIATWLWLEELTSSFEAYASELGIERRAQFIFDEPQWATYEDGKTDRLVGCFAPMVCDLTVAYLDEYPDPADHNPAVVEATILSLVKTGLKDLFELEPPTWPWRPDDLFDREDFELAFRKMVRDVLNAMPSAMKTPSAGTKRLGTIRQALLRFFAPTEELPAAALWASFSREAESVADRPQTEMNQAMPSVPNTAGSSISKSAEPASGEKEHEELESGPIRREERLQAFIGGAHPGSTLARKPTRKGDITLLRKADGSLYQSVAFTTAESYGDISARRRQQLMTEGVLKVIGKGLKRRITVESLMAYCPSTEDAK
jgi:hypothetical protein